MIIRIAVSLLPVFAFLYAFFSLDSYKLIPPRSIGMAICAGCGAALLALAVNLLLDGTFQFGEDILPRYIAPPVEELCKAGYLVYLLRKAKIGFLVDAAIYGFAIGAGFALVENVYYLQALATSNILVWIIRGFGTAIMHGGVTALFGVAAKYSSDLHGSVSFRSVASGYLLAVVIHSGFNHAFFAPVIMTVLILFIFPAIFYVIFQRSQGATKQWLREGMDSDIEMLEVILTGELGATRVGAYLRSIQTHFSGEVIGDMLCLLRLNLELSMRAKGMLLMREAGIEMPSDPESAGKLRELEYLQKTIGVTGMLALKPFLPHSTRELWQINLVN